ncbi:hypothetical protein BJY01DRAFT_179266 [Aspergillus pseudoustus]|uniref:DUF202 domain-containing protein n=1 Tax=Aspergillus pseudoustus TaxID=1810923 RepID=A0ABR4KXC5_9EURO
MASLFRRLLPKPVANTGSQLRDHQANERTFLSWTRMGLAFAAMGLAVGRLGLIEHLFNPVILPSVESDEPAGRGATTIPAAGPGSSDSARDNRMQERSPPPSTKEKEKTSPDLLASRLCQAISVWSFGYGIFRYLSVRRNLARGQFVPAIWGPLVMTAGTLGVIGVIIQMDWKRPHRTQLSNDRKH